MSQTLWLSPKVLEWRPFLESYSMSAESAWERSYEHWKHADHLLAAATDEFHRTDIVTTLKRALDVRLKLLASVYGFRRMPVQGLPTGQIEQLSFLGVLRPLLIGKLLEIRNRVEHQDAEPPTLSHCAELVDVVWYFLRSTDGMVRQVPTNILLDKSAGAHHEQHFLDLEVQPPESWELQCRGRLDPKWVRDDLEEGWIALHAIEFERLGERALRAPSPEAAELLARQNPDDVHIAGQILGPPAPLLAFYQYFLRVR